jgi:hypothetical protein
MYAPLDFRLVIGPEPTLTNLQQNKAATDRHGFHPGSKNKSVFMRANSWSRVTHFGGAKWPQNCISVRLPPGI